MPNVLIAVYVHPRALPWAIGNIWAYSPPQSLQYAPPYYYFNFSSKKRVMVLKRW